MVIIFPGFIQIFYSNYIKHYFCEYFFNFLTYILTPFIFVLNKSLQLTKKGVWNYSSFLLHSFYLGFFLWKYGNSL